MRRSARGFSWRRIAVLGAAMAIATLSAAQAQNYQSSPTYRTAPSNSPTYRSTTPSYQTTPSYRSTTPSYQPTTPSYQSQPTPQRAQPAPIVPPVQTARTPQPAGDTARNSAACMNDKNSVPPDTAIAGCNNVIQDTTGNLATAFYFRGEAHALKRDYDRAIADYTQAIALSPNDADFLNGRAAAYEAKKDLDRAMADYNQAIKVNPKAVAVFNSRAAVFQRKGDYARASADYGAVTRLQPNNADAWGARCWVRAIDGRELRQALSDCDQALKIRPDSADVLDTRGVVNLKLNQNDAALRDFDAALKLEPKLASSLYGRGIIRMRKGDRNGGTADITAAKSMKADIAEELGRYGVR